MNDKSAILAGVEPEFDDVAGDYVDVVSTESQQQQLELIGDEVEVVSEVRSRILAVCAICKCMLILATLGYRANALANDQHAFLFKAKST